MQIVNKINGDVVETTTRAWWLNFAIESSAGVAVARVHADSTTLRVPSAEQIKADPSLNPYWADTENKGRLQNYMLDLTEEDLKLYAIKPGILIYPEIIDGDRPASNTAKKIVSAHQHAQSQAWLQNDCIGKPSDY
jgi:hypothetical protein